MALYNPIVVNTTVNNDSGQKSTTVVPTTIPVPDDTVLSQILAVANPNRKGMALWNKSDNAVYVELGGAATPTTYTFKFNPGGYYEIPFGFTGEVQGLWSAPGGDGILVREFI